ncbi:receptor protein kinase-like protein ZAR1 [Fagus crenata]
MSFQVSEADCIVSNFVSHDGEASLTCSVLVNNRLEVSIIKEVKPNPKCLKLTKGSIYIEELPIYNFLSSSQPCPASLVASTSRQSENPREDTREREVKLAIDEISPHDKMSSIMGYTPLKLSQEEIKDIRWNFSDRIKNFSFCDGFLPGFKSRVLMKSFTRDSGGVLKAEKTSAVSMCHKNIYTKEYTGCTGKQSELTFQKNIKLAIGIAEGIRYMHEECPRGPVVHGELMPSNIYLSNDFRPLISGFGKAKWLHLRKPLHITHNRLFFRRSAPQDDRVLIDWARPLLLRRALPELLDEDSEDVDIHGIYRVIAILKGEKFCEMQSSPSSKRVYEDQ